MQNTFIGMGLLNPKENEIITRLSPKPSDF